MLVCSACGTPVAVAGHPCPSCGHKGSIDSRFFQGEAKPAAAGQAPAPVELPTHEPSLAGTIPDAQRGWSPWLAAAAGVVFGPVAGCLIAAGNVRRLRQAGTDPFVVALGMLVAQLLLGVAMGFLAKAQPGGAWILYAVFVLLAAAAVVRWQWGPVMKQRRTHPGRHTPGADAFGLFFLGALLGLVGFLVMLKIGDKIGAGAVSGWYARFFPAPAPAPMPMPAGMPGM